MTVTIFSQETCGIVGLYEYLQEGCSTVTVHLSGTLFILCSEIWHHNYVHAENKKENLDRSSKSHILCRFLDVN